MNYFNYKRRNLFSGPHLLGPLLILAGLIALLGPLFIIQGNSIIREVSVGAGALILGLVIVTSYRGTHIDFYQKKFRNYISICGYKFGEWTSLPLILKVTVVPLNYRSHNTPNGISPTLSGKVSEFRTLIYSNESNPMFTFIYSDRANAVKHANTLASNLNANLAIYTIQERDL